MKKVLTLFTSALFSLNLFAQVVFIPRIHLRVDDADEKSISITGMDIEAKITANTAITTYDIVFYNDSSRNLEGEFEFPLKEGQSVCGFALDINGKMRDGVIVEKDKGRQVFEDVVRSLVDPALLEVTAGSNFKARVYPIPRKGSRHIQIKIQENLTEPKFVLNPLTDMKIRRFSFKLIDYRNSVAEDSVSSDIIDLDTGIAATFERKEFNWTKPIEVKLAKQASVPEVFVETSGTDSYFFVPVPVNVKSEPKDKITNLGLLFDSSLSRKDCNIEKELDLLKAYLNKQGSGSVEIVNFSNEVKSQKTFKFSQFKDIEAYIKAITYDGATNLNNIDFKPSKKYDEILIFSDGISNWDITEKSVLFNCPVNTVSSADRADYGELKRIARNNNGIFINLASTKVSDAVEKLTVQPLRLIKVTADSGLKEIYPAAGSVVTDNFSVAGILKNKSGSLKLQFGYGDKPAFEKTIQIDSVTGYESENVGRLWAQKKIDELSLNYEKNKNEILNVSREFTIVTEGTSLIVLENVRDYVRYKITPPDELLEEYNQILGIKPKKIEKNGIPDNVYRCFEDFKKWWKTTPEEFEKLYKKREKNGDSGEMPVLRLNGRAARAGDFDLEIDTTNNVMTASSRASESDVQVIETEELAVNKEVQTEEDSAAKATVVIQAWNPKADYLKILKKTETKLMYEKYLELREGYISSPSFYMEVADYFYKEDLKKEAIRILSNLSELNLENSDMLRALGNKLMDFDCCDIAAKIFEHLIIIRPEVPQFLRDAALAYRGCGEYQKACDLLYEVACKEWASRYDQIQQVCLNDMNSIIALHKVDVSKYDKDLVENFAMDVRIVLTWNTDNCDIDLWVTDPNGEKCYYAHNSTLIGGRLSRDFTQGYGPEEFCLRKAKEGSYRIQAHYYGAHQQKVLQPVTVQAEVYTNFGRPEQTCELLTLQLKNVDGDYTIGEIKF